MVRVLTSALALLVLAAASCERAAAPPGELRIVSLSPATTGVLVALGLRDRIVGVDRFSRELPGLADVPSLGGLFAPDLERTLELRPTAVLAVRSESQSAFLAQLRARGIAVHEIDTSGSLDEVLANYAAIGALVGREAEGRALAERVRAELAEVAASVAGRPRPTVALVVEREPLYVVAGASFASALIEAAGGRNAFADVARAYPQISLEVLAERAPEVLIDSTQTAQSADAERDARAYWGRYAWVGRVELVPPGVATLPGAELARGAELLRARIHPELGVGLVSPRARVLAALALTLAAALSVSLLVGSAEHATAAIVLEIRLPRALLAALVGAGLATAGALLQALLQNPLADPYVLGISGGAALGGVLALALGGGAVLGLLSVPIVAFAGALAASLLLYAIAGAGGRAPAHSLLLTGVVFNAFASSLIVFATSAADLARVAGVFLWLIGSIRLVEPVLLAAVAVLFAVGLGIALYFAFALNLVAQGDETAAHLGVDVPRVRRWVFAGTALMIGASVSVSGLIGFVGLIVPHLLRLAFGSDHRLLVPASALGGAVFLVVADTLARVVLAPTELPVGALTALVGGPLFLVLLRRELARLPA